MNKKTLAWAACLVFSLVSGMPAAQAQSYPPPPQSFSQQDLDQMLAPVALYPDDLLAQVLMASTYPLEVVQAQRFVEARPGLQGDALARSVAPMPWDPSVKALVQFPAVLAMMNDRLDWMQRLGQAFLADQGEVMDTVQSLRMRAQQAGNLQSTPQQRVFYEDDMVMIEPVNPQVVYVPYYNPTIVYGNWWWPSAPPVYWTPPPRYRPPHYSPGVTVGITFGSGIGVMRAAFSEARPDWRQRQVFVTQTRVNQVNNNTTINRNVVINNRPVVWRHDPRYVNRNPQQPGVQGQPGGPGNQPPRGPQAGNSPPQGLLQQPQPRPGMQDHRPDFRPQDRGPESRPQFNPQQAAPTPQQRVIQDDRARERMVRDQQAQQQREMQAQQRQREEMVRDQQRQHEDMARQQRAQQQQHQQQMMQMQQRQDQQMRQQQEHMRREQQERPQQAAPQQRPPEQPRTQPQQQQERQPQGERRRHDDNR